MYVFLWAIHKPILHLILFLLNYGFKSLMLMSIISPDPALTSWRRGRPKCPDGARASKAAALSSSGTGQSGVTIASCTHSTRSHFFFYSPPLFLAETGNMVLNPHLHQAVGAWFSFCACNLSSSLATHKLIARAICLLVQIDAARAFSKSDLLGLSKPLAKSNCLPHAGTIATSEVSTKWRWLKVNWV